MENLGQSLRPATFNRVTRSRCPQGRWWKWLVVAGAYILLTAIITPRSHNIQVEEAVMLFTGVALLIWLMQRWGIWQRWVDTPPPALESGESVPCFLALIAPSGLAHSVLAFDDAGQSRELMLTPDVGWLASAEEKRAAAWRWLAAVHKRQMPRSLPL